MTDVTFVRTTDRGEQAPRTIYAVPADMLDQFIADLASIPGLDIDQVPADALPGLAEMFDAAVQRIAALATGPGSTRIVVEVGTSVGDAWTTWYPPVDAPPVPR